MALELLIKHGIRNLAEFLRQPSSSDFANPIFLSYLEERTRACSPPYARVPASRSPVIWAATGKQPALFGEVVPMGAA